MEIPFTHRQSAHCETGTTSNLLNHYGVPVSEAMVFGIGAGLFFGYLPFIKLNNLPLTTFRSATGAIFKRTTRELAIKVETQRFRDPEKAMVALDSKLDQGIPVGIQTGAYWLPYFPPAFRFHFNMHNSIVIAKRDDEYLISDPVFPEPVLCSAHHLKLARFAKGTLAPKGKMYVFREVPQHVDLMQPIKKGIKVLTNAMLKNPVPLLGVRGIRYLAGQLEKWPRKFGKDQALLYLGQVVRMQEEIGTGGAGFRFIFAAFLQEAASTLEDNRFQAYSERMTQIGDHWREFAVVAARNCKGRAGENDSYAVMARILIECADQEELLYQDLANSI